MVDQIIETICEFSEENDTLNVYQKTMSCCLECVLLKKDLFSNQEQEIIQKGYELFKSNYDFNEINSLRAIISKTYSQENKGHRKMALEALMSALMPFESWTKKYERPNAIDYCIFYLREAGVTEEELIPPIKKYKQSLGV